jgi:hypothetical protein
MTASHLDQLTYKFLCSGPQCGNAFEQTLRSLIQAKEVVCPACGATKDIRESRSTGEIGQWIDTAMQLDQHTNQKK